MNGDIRPCFEAGDLDDRLPPAGLYRASIANARFRQSARGNDTLQVVFDLEAIEPPHNRLAEYFVIGGATPRTLAIVRRRLLDLYRACGLSPQAGDAIDPADLYGGRLEVRVEHEEWDGQLRLRVAAHRPLREAPA